jgi:uncharacterized protein
MMVTEQMTLVANASRETVLAERAKVARGPWAQFMGLMGRAELAAGGGLVLPRTRGVHTHFMRFPIDVVFYDRGGTVVGIAEALPPWRFSRYYFKAVGAIELPAGTARATGTRPGDLLSLPAA